MGPKNPISGACFFLMQPICDMPRRNRRQSADGAPRTTAPPVFAKEYWILKD